jgi:hypothetical protein
MVVLRGNVRFAPLIIIHGVRDSDYRFPSGGWYCFIVFNAGNYALYLLERHRKKKESEKQ